MAKRPPIFYILLAIAFAASVFVSLLGVMAAMWGGAPSISAFLFWFLPVLSLPVWVSYFMLPKTAVIASWLLMIANHAAFFVGIWSSSDSGNSTTTNPFVIALDCLYGSPFLPGLFVFAACLHLSARIDQLSKFLDAPSPPS
jgi:hypothetical protein